MPYSFEEVPQIQIYIDKKKIMNQEQALEAKN
jgi:hypothetical protein